MFKIFCFIVGVLFTVSCSNGYFIDEPKKEEPAPQNVDDWIAGGEEDFEAKPD